jgi:hypothetical protein
MAKIKFLSSINVSDLIRRYRVVSAGVEGMTAQNPAEDHPDGPQGRATLKGLFRITGAGRIKPAARRKKAGSNGFENP